MEIWMQAAIIIAACVLDREIEKGSGTVCQLSVPGSAGQPDHLCGGYPAFKNAGFL